jgi:hypothetical protein
MLWVHSWDMHTTWQYIHYIYTVHVGHWKNLSGKACLFTGRSQKTCQCQRTIMPAGQRAWVGRISVGFLILAFILGKRLYGCRRLFLLFLILYSFSSWIRWICFGNGTCPAILCRVSGCMSNNYLHDSWDTASRCDNVYLYRRSFFGTYSQTLKIQQLWKRKRFTNHLRWK